MSAMVLRGGSVLTEQGVEECDVVIVDGTIAGFDGSGFEDASVVDVTGCWVGPGLIDVHVHLREPGQEWKEDIASGREAAAAGGFTTVVAMPNTDPAIDAGHVARDVWRRDGVVVVPAGAITAGRNGERLAHLDDLWAEGVRLFTDDGDTVTDAGLLRRAMEYVGQLGGVIAQHAEDPGLSRNGHMHEGAVSSRLGMFGLPAAAEEVIVARDLRLVELTGCRYHVQHVSTAGTVQLVEAAKSAGLPVTAEVAPHHLVFDHTMVRTMDPVYKMYPPLRTPADVEALRTGLMSGIIDMVATDHAPHSAHEKDVPFEDAPRGVIGLETAVGAVIDACQPDQATLFHRMAIAPAALMGIDHGPLATGRSADIVVVDPSRPHTVEAFRSRSANSPWKGATLPASIVMTIAGGDIVYQKAEEAHA